MEKDFFGWAKVKANLHQRRKINFFDEREVWWCALGANVGHEQDGKGRLWTRPVLVLRKFNKHMLWAVPMTSKGKSNNPYYLEVIVGEGTSYLLLSQLRLVSSRRLIDKIGTLDPSLRSVGDGLELRF